MRRPTAADLSPFLGQDEHVRWSGAPPKGIMFRGFDLFFIPFSMVWAGFVIFWNVSLWLALLRGFSKGAPWDILTALGSLALFLFVGLVFLGFGYQILIGRFISDMQDRAGTLYAITNHRAIIAKGHKLGEVRGYELALGAQISVTEGRGGSGSITLGQPDPWYSAQNTPVSVSEFKFERIAHVREAARLIDEVRGKSR